MAKSSYLVIRQFTTLSTLSGNIIYTDHLESYQKRLGSFGRLDLVGVFWDDHFALHCIGSHFVSRASLHKECYSYCTL